MFWGLGVIRSPDEMDGETWFHNPEIGVSLPGSSGKGPFVYDVLPYDLGPPVNIFPLDTNTAGGSGAGTVKDEIPITHDGEIIESGGIIYTTQSKDNSRSSNSSVLMLGAFGLIAGLALFAKR